jgi:hypothetical protein
MQPHPHSPSTTLHHTPPPHSAFPPPFLRLPPFFLRPSSAQQIRVERPLYYYSNRFILQKNSPACRTNALLRKYGDTSARCTSFGPYFNNGNQNQFYIELAQAENYYGERRRNQSSFTVGIYRGGRMPLIY